MIEFFLELIGGIALELSGDNKVSKPVRTFLVSAFFIPVTVFFSIISVKMFLDSAVLWGLVFVAFSLISVGALVWLCRKIKRNK